jgi:2-oxoisovalerate dehydrogenase E2 component (dihydrolipoyl transacylase)
MKYFRLPDLGEGLQDAEIVEWHVSVGDTVSIDQLLVSVETAKAIVDIPSPQHGKIAALFGDVGDQIHINEPLLEFSGEHQHDEGTVVGNISAALEMNTQGENADHFIIGSAHKRATGNQLATPAIRALAARLHVNLNEVSATGRNGLISSDDVEKSARLREQHGAATPLRGVRRAMAKNMSRSHEQVVSVTLHDDVDVAHWAKDTDITMRLVQALASACRAEPNLNAWFDGDALTLRTLTKIDLGIAVDTADGLFVPVLRDVSNRESDDLRAGLQRLRADVTNRTIPAAEMIGATITISNFGTIAGRYGNPIIVPPQVAILGAGVIRDQVVALKGQPAIHAVLPLSLSFDHRAITGGEAARFLRALMDALSER